MVIMNKYEHLDRLSRSSLARCQIPFNDSNSEEIQRILFDLGFIWSSGSDEPLILPSGIRYICVNVRTLASLVEADLDPDPDECKFGWLSYSRSVGHADGYELVSYERLIEIHHQLKPNPKSIFTPTTTFADLW